VVAETFLVAWRRVEHVPTDALPWLCTVAGNVIATQRRSVGRRHALDKRLQINAVGSVGQPEVDDGPVLEALANLSATDREALTLIAWDGLQPHQAAAMLGQSPSTFRVRLHRAKRRFRRLLEAERAEMPSPYPLTETVPARRP
jgi:RNA polymerase sigma-70 factor (ECF subfamily)